MPEKPEQFDFSKPEEEQERFPAQSQDIQENEVENAHDKANRMAVIINNLEKKRNIPTDIPDDIITTPEVQSVAKKRMIEALHSNYLVDYAIKIRDQFHISQETLASPEVQSIAKERMIEKLSFGLVDDAIKIRDQFHISQEILASPEVKYVAKKAMIAILHSIILVDYAIKIRDQFHISQETLASPEIQSAVAKKIKEKLCCGDIEGAINVRDEFRVPEDEFKTLLTIYLVDYAILKNNPGNFEDSVSDKLDELEKYGVGPIILFPNGRIPISHAMRHIETNVWTVDINADLFDKDYVMAAEKKNISLSEYLCVFGENPKDEDLTDQKLLERLIQSHPAWQDEENISGPFKEGAEYFGYERMFQYLGQRDRHDTLYNFRKIVRLAQNSGLAPAQFFGQILDQVKADGAMYDGQDATARLNSIADAVDPQEVGTTLSKAQEYSGIPQLAALIEDFSDKQNIFQSWKHLKKYYELTQLLARTEVLDQLKDLNEQGNNKLASFVGSLAFHPSIDMQKVLQFWREPEAFLDTGEIHAAESHDRKKPSNYIHIPHLDLTAENLRDVAVNGDLDALQDWQLLEITYDILERRNEGDTEEMDPKKLIIAAVGSRKEGKKGTAREPRKMFFELQRIFKEAGADLMAFMGGREEIDQTLAQKVRELVFHPEFGMKKKEIPMTKFRAAIMPKSDPAGVVAGNDTACCMPFGSGKNNVYMFNPGCSQFVIQKQVGEEWRTVAQSVLTKDIPIGKNVAEILASIQEVGAHLDEVVDENILVTTPRIITADNIEVAPNFQDTEGAERILQSIYKDFFREYAARFSPSEQLDATRMIVGKGYTDLSIGTSVDNQFVPVAPMGYSDNLGSSALEIDLQQKEIAQAMTRSIRDDINKPQRKDNPEIVERGIEPLTFQDSLQVAYLEGKAYKENESLIQNLHNMENCLIAKDINNVSKGRTNLSLKYVDTSKKMQGYLLAYEGISRSERDYDDEDYDPDEVEGEGKRVIYIADLAANPESKMAGGRLIKSFVILYKKLYLDKRDYVPVMADTRDKTSYQIILKQLEGIGKDLGIEFETQEGRSYYQGNDEMHPLMIRPVIRPVVS